MRLLACFYAALAAACAQINAQDNETVAFRVFLADASFDQTFVGAGLNPLTGDAQFGASITPDASDPADTRIWTAVERADGTVPFRAYINEPINRAEIGSSRRLRLEAPEVAAFDNSIVVNLFLENDRIKLGQFDISTAPATLSAAVEYTPATAGLPTVLAYDFVPFQSVVRPVSILEDLGSAVHVVNFNEDLTLNFDRTYTIPFVASSTAPGFSRFSIRRLSDDSGYFITYTDLVGFVNPRLGVIRVDTSGAVIWARTFDLTGIPGIVPLPSIRPLPGNALIVVVDYSGTTTRESDVLVVNGDGSLRWASKFADLSLSLTDSQPGGTYQLTSPRLWLVGFRDVASSPGDLASVFLGLNATTGAIERQASFKDSVPGVVLPIINNDDSLICSYFDVDISFTVGPGGIIESETVFTRGLYRFDFDLVEQASTLVDQPDATSLPIFEVPATDTFLLFAGLPSRLESIQWVVDEDFVPVGPNCDFFLPAPAALEASSFALTSITPTVTNQLVTAVDSTSSIANTTIAVQEIAFVAVRATCLDELPEIEGVLLPEAQVGLRFTTLPDVTWDVVFGTDLNGGASVVETGMGTGDVEVRVLPRSGPMGFWQVQNHTPAAP